jgi:LuxR family maltose regulon positive regulatory protein
VDAAYRFSTDDLPRREVDMAVVADIEQYPSHLTPLVADLLAEIETTREAFEPSSVSEGLHRFDIRPDELSGREVEVLRYLPTMLTASEIAGELYLSVNTIKAHVRSIYRKLGAHRRREAVDRAYTCGIL